MILSVSRRTDIPQYYSDWFYNRMKEGFLYVKNPMNCHQVSKILLSAGLVEFIVFWTKNPAPMMGRIGELGDIPYYIQFTLTGYGRDIEPGLPDKRQLIRNFRAAASVAGSGRMVWRYDPIFCNERYPAEYHIHAFEEIAKGICGCTDRAIISFLDLYGKTKRNMSGIPVGDLDETEMRRIGKALAEIASRYGMKVESCAEKADLSSVGIGHASCVDPGRIAELTGLTVMGKKDKNQRAECGCMESVEVGTYDTCLCGCKYCYANDSLTAARRRNAQYSADSPLLCQSLEKGDKITVRKVNRVLGG